MERYGHYLFEIIETSESVILQSTEYIKTFT